ncbi:hypothetical protein [Cyclobacterium plantarum]|uniref:hypothetical protein n=1 Tax=Cyclobacterium plantarum TaxID=2716263 RepID=UPI003F717844
MTCAKDQIRGFFQHPALGELGVYGGGNSKIRIVSGRTGKTANSTTPNPRIFQARNANPLILAKGLRKEMTFKKGKGENPERIEECCWKNSESEFPTACRYDNQNRNSF